jgi:hypothetical protein
MAAGSPFGVELLAAITGQGAEREGLDLIAHGERAYDLK